MLKGREKLASVSDEMRIIPIVIAHKAVLPLEEAMAFL